MNGTILPLLILAACMTGLLAAVAAATISLVRRGQRFARDNRARAQARESLAQFHIDLATSSGMRLTWQKPEDAQAQEHALALELIGGVDVETIDQDGNTQRRYRVDNGRAVVPVSAGVHTAASIDGIDKIDVYIIEGHVNSVNVTLRSGLTLGTASLSP